MSCQAWQELLQRHLDGLGPPDALDAHLRACPDCAAHQAAVRRLKAGLGLLRTPVPPADLGERILSQLLAETPPARQRRPRVFTLTALAAAAALLLAVSLWAWRTMAGKPTPDTGPDSGAIVHQPPVKPKPQEPAASPLRDSMAEGATAVAALTSRTAAQTIDQTTLLLPLVPSPLETLSPSESPMDPPLEPLREAGAGVSSGLAPVADSARRAVNLFFRDLPMGRSDDKDPG